MLAVLRQRDFALVWAAGTISVVGDWMLLVALPFHVYQLTGSTLAAGAMFVASTLPALLFGSVAGVFVDRWDRRRTVIVVDALRGGVVLVLLAAQRPEWLWLVYLAAFTQAAVGQFFGPARGALVARLVSRERLTAANALDALSTQATGLVGPALGGALAAAFGLAPVVLLDSVSFLVSAALLAFVRPPDPAPDVGEARAVGGLVAAWGRLWGEVRAGLGVVRRDRTVWAVFLVVGLAWLGQGIINALVVPFVTEVLGGDERQYGWTYTAQAVGGVAGGLLVGRLSGRVRPAWLMAAGGLGIGVLLWLIVHLPAVLRGAGVAPLPPVLALYVLVGVAVVALFVPHIALLQQSVPDRFRGRVFGALRTSTTLATLVGLGIGSAAGQATGPVALLSLAAALYGLGGGAAFLVPRGGVAVATDEATPITGSRARSG